MDGILTHLALLTPAFSLPSAPAVLTVNLRRPWNAPLPLMLMHESAISVLCLAPVHLRRSVTRLVSYYALFKGWLLLSQPPSCNFGTLIGDLGLFSFRVWTLSPTR